MKNLNLIILVLAGTIFAACSKKSDSGGGNTNQDPYYNNGYYNNGYQQNGYGQNQLLVFNTNLGCNGQTPQLINNLVDYCSWLAEEARYECNINAVKREFMGRCMHMANTYNFCVGGSVSVGGSYYYSSSYGSGYRSRYSSSGRVREEPIRHNTNSTTISTPVYTQTSRPTVVVSAPPPQQQVVTQPQQRPTAVVNTAPTTTQTSTPLQTSTQTKCVDKVVKINPAVSDEYVRSEYKIDGKVLNYKVDCLADYAMTGCRKSGSNLLQDRIKISGDANFEQMKRAANRIAGLAESGSGALECKLHSDGNVGTYRKTTWQDLKNDCGALTATEKVVRECQESVAPATPAPVAQVAPLADAQPADLEVLPVPKKFLKDCFSLEEIHNDIMNPANKLASYSSQYIVTELKNLTAADEINITETIYGLPLSNGYSLGSHRMSPDQTTGARTGSSIAATVSQVDDKLTLNGATGEIIVCEGKNYMEVAFDNEQKQKSYVYKFTLTRPGEMAMTVQTDETLVSGQRVRLDSLNYIIWKDLETVDALTNRELHKDLMDLSRELVRDIGYENIDEKIKTTLDLLNPGKPSTYNAAKDEAAQKIRDEAFRKAYDASSLSHKKSSK